MTTKIDLDDLRALTLWRPWSEAIVYGTKRIENRPWRPWPHVLGKMIAIHAGAKYDIDGSKMMARAALYLPQSPTKSPRGIVGIARVTGCVTQSDDPWFFGPYGWTLEERGMLPRPIPCNGALGLWRVPSDIVREIRKMEAEIVYQD